MIQVKYQQKGPQKSAHKEKEKQPLKALARVKRNGFFKKISNSIYWSNKGRIRKSERTGSAQIVAGAVLKETSSICEFLKGDQVLR